ncbi:MULTISPECIES: phosphonopyruvate decarboxylase [Butyricimonas]|uniref:phosphonopyruvate decarboxylase n=1 Tax=Butyricimonas TaxID=574697 RepID=UPI00207F9DC8|nr:phosphonopyruvate decarboxylase [Butyricimonas paravirosa]BDF54355.1 phosphonopyruvate decarboxylase [Odoribacteraceae bacterium]GKH93217.1 phosphonopyruvate decarboxylase [Odoribacteraceae bacterium]GKH99891.1 phosphonopyruvate decarboxylase [Odoribacteraceae bacterium]GKI04412.1 phosphonopyruvate decarboxylase [Odoribacteraceae bacterium]
MLNQERVFEELAKHGVTFFTGVPDSYLNGFCNYALNNCGSRNIIAANEGNAVGIASGHYFASKEISLVYMQNSGLGNTVNPLASLVDKDVYAVPMLLLVGWRGQGNTEPNHPQHKLQGEITPELLEIMHIPYTILEDDDDKFAKAVEKAVKYCKETRQPYGLIAPKGVMAASDKPNNVDNTYPMSREEAMEIILNNMPGDAIYSATTGRATRELFFLREKRCETKEHDFLNVGSMGHVSSVALGIALEKPGRKVVALDGDSACMMHMGAMTMVCKLDVPNFMHIVLNNGAHESVGGQPSAGHKVDFTKIAEACGYATVGHSVTTEVELVEALAVLRDCGKASFIDCRIHKGLSRKLPPIVFDHREVIDDLIDALSK